MNCQIVPNSSIIIKNMILIRSLGKITLLPQRFAFSSSNLHDVPPMIRKVQEKIKILTP